MDDARTRSQGMMDIDYSIRLYELHARFYRRLRKLFTFISLASGTAVVATVLNANTTAALIISALLALLPIVENIIDPSGKAVFYDLYRKRFCELRARVVNEKADIDQIDTGLSELYAEPSDDIEALRRVALRDNLRAYGHEDWLPLPLTFYERVWSFLA